MTPARERRAAELNAGEAAVAPDNVLLPIHFNHTIVVFVGNQDVAVGQQFGAVGVVELIEAVSGHSGLAILPHDFLGQVDFNNARIGLVSDQYVKIRQPCILHRSIQLVKSRSRYSRLAILPDDLSRGIH